MAIYYKHPHFLTQVGIDLFDQLFEPGQNTVHPGAYRCAVCGKSVVSVASHPLPPQNHHQHDPGAGRIQWQLAVWPAS